MVNDVVAERAEAVAASIRAAGGAATAAPFDVTDFEAVQQAVDGIGRVDVLVNNAGNGGAEQMAVRPFRELDPSAWEGPIRVNLYGVLHCCKAVVDGMCERGWGRIITISSGAGTGRGRHRGVAVQRGQGRRHRVHPHAGPRGRPLGRHRQHAGDRAAWASPTPTSRRRWPRAIPVGRTGTAGRHRARPASGWPRTRPRWVTGQTIQINGGSITT